MPKGRQWTRRKWRRPGCSCLDWSGLECVCVGDAPATPASIRRRQARVLELRRIQAALLEHARALFHRVSNRLDAAERQRGGRVDLERNELAGERAALSQIQPVRVAANGL